MRETSTTLKRRLDIVDLVRKEGEVRVEALSEQLGVSTVTIRADLNYLEQQGYVVRGFGKARYNAALLAATSLPAEATHADRPAQEQRMAQHTLRWIDDGLCVFLGAGEVMHRVLPQLVQVQNLTLTLHDLAMVNTAQQFLQADLQVTGGVCRRDEPGLVGPSAEQSISSHPLDLCVIEVHGLDAQGRIFHRAPGAARLYARAMAHAKQTLAVVSSTDANTASGAHGMGDLGLLDGVILHQDLDPALIDTLLASGLHVDTKVDGLLDFKRQA